MGEETGFDGVKVYINFGMDNEQLIGTIPTKKEMQDRAVNNVEDVIKERLKYNVEYANNQEKKYDFLIKMISIYKLELLLIVRYRNDEITYNQLKNSLMHLEIRRLKN